MRRITTYSPRYVSAKFETARRKEPSQTDSSIFERFFERPEDPAITHQLREAAVVGWMRAGIFLEEASRLLGYVNIQTKEKRYMPWAKMRRDRTDLLVTAVWREMGQHSDAGQYSPLYKPPALVRFLDSCPIWRRGPGRSKSRCRRQG